MREHGQFVKESVLDPEHRRKWDELVRAPTVEDAAAYMTGDEASVWFDLKTMGTVHFVTWYRPGEGLFVQAVIASSVIRQERVSNLNRAVDCMWHWAHDLGCLSGDIGRWDELLTAAKDAGILIQEQIRALRDLFTGVLGYEEFLGRMKEINYKVALDHLHESRLRLRR